jgi:hypothetical protein
MLFHEILANKDDFEHVGKLRKIGESKYRDKINRSLVCALKKAKITNARSYPRAALAIRCCANALMRWVHGEIPFSRQKARFENVTFKAKNIDYKNRN